jgi:hypothetical protein
MRVTVFEQLFEQQRSYDPSPAELLAVGLCYSKLRKREVARRWLTEASKHRETKAQAIDALERLD